MHLQYSRVNLIEMKQKKLFFINNVIWIFRLFQIFHLCPFSMSGRPNITFYLKIYSIFGILIRFVVLAYTSIEHKLFIPVFRNGISWTIMCAMVGCVRSLELIICVEVYFQRDKHFQFLTKLNHVDYLLVDKLSVNMKYNHLKRHTYSVAFAWILFHLSIIFIIIYLSLNDIDKTILKFVYFQSFIGASIYYLQITFYVRMLGSRFKLLNEIFDEMSLIKTNKFPSCDPGIAHVIYYELGLSDNVYSSSAQFILKQMIVIRKIYHELWELTEYVNHMFRFSLPACIGMDFVSMLSVVYWFVLNILEIISNETTNDGISTIACFVWSLLNGLHLFYLSKCCHDTQQIANLIPITLHKVKINVILYNDKLRNFFQHFSMQLLHQKVQFNAFGFFTIDYTLVFMVCAIETFDFYFLHIYCSKFSLQKNKITLFFRSSERFQLI